MIGFKFLLGAEQLWTMNFLLSLNRMSVHLALIMICPPYFAWSKVRGPYPSKVKAGLVESQPASRPSRKSLKTPSSAKSRVALNEIEWLIQ